MDAVQNSTVYRLSVVIRFVHTVVVTDLLRDSTNRIDSSIHQSELLTGARIKHKQLRYFEFTLKRHILEGSVASKTELVAHNSRVPKLLICHC